MSKANINTEDIELEFTDHKVRIRAANQKSKRKTFDTNSPLWDFVGFAQAEGINGRNHDECIYDEN